GLRRELHRRQIGMIAVGGAIGTGPLLGSGLALSLAGPAVILAYVVAPVRALVLAYALAEMVVRHPEPGGFRPITQRYLGHGAGFAQRCMYWAAQVVNFGSEVVAAGLYLTFWYPDLPRRIRVVGFSVVVLAVNAGAVRFFGETEYWFAMIKVVTIVAFIAVGLVAIVFGLPGQQPAGLGALTAHEIVAADDTAHQGAGPTVAVPQRHRRRTRYRLLPALVALLERRQPGPRPPPRPGRACQRPAEELAGPVQGLRQSQHRLQAHRRSSDPHDRQHLTRLAKAHWLTPTAAGRRDTDAIAESVFGNGGHVGMPGPAGVVHRVCRAGTTASVPLGHQ
ncbi:amino acid permease, partial [Microbacterium sp. HSID17254]|uniref:amino acid permease n=1 Tax=Microbacterium sp. HSID17254 TaxID=2419509 RepID=UPI000F97B03A